MCAERSWFFFLSCCVAVRIKNIFLLLWKLLTKSNDFTVSRFRISIAASGFSWKVTVNPLMATEQASVTRFRMLEAAFSNPLQNQYEKTRHKRLTVTIFKVAGGLRKAASSILNQVTEVIFKISNCFQSSKNKFWIVIAWQQDGEK